MKFFVQEFLEEFYKEAACLKKKSLPPPTKKNKLDNYQILSMLQENNALLELLSKN